MTSRKIAGGIRAAAALALLAGAGAASAQEPAQDVLAITGARILTGAKGEIASGTIVVRGGKIAEIGESVQPPKEAKLIDGRGLVAMPGLIHVTSGLGGSGGSGGTASTPHIVAGDDFIPTSPLLRQLPRHGVTSIAIHPGGGTICGQVSVLKLIEGTREEMLLSKSACLWIEFQPNTESKEQLRRDLERAKTALEAEKKKGAAAPAKEGATTESGGDSPSEERRESVVRFLKGEIAAIVVIPSAGAVFHYAQVVKPFSSFKMRTLLYLPPESYRVIPRISELGSAVLLDPEMGYLPFTRVSVNTPAEMARAGIKVVLGVSDARASYESLLFRTGQLVKGGLPRDAALAALTAVPARLLGLEKRIGTLEAGKDADIVLLDGDPFNGPSRVMRTLIDGKVVFQR